MIPLTAAVLLFEVPAWLRACGLQNDAWQPACLCLKADAGPSETLQLCWAGVLLVCLMQIDLSASKIHAAHGG